MLSKWSRLNSVLTQPSLQPSVIGHIPGILDANLCGSLYSMVRGSRAGTVFISAAIYWVLPCTHWPCVILSHHRRWVLWCLFYRWAHRSTERLNNFPKVTLSEWLNQELNLDISDSKFFSLHQNHLQCLQLSCWDKQINATWTMRLAS